MCRNQLQRLQLGVLLVVSKRPARRASLAQAKEALGALEQVRLADCAGALRSCLLTEQACVCHLAALVIRNASVSNVTTCQHCQQLHSKTSSARTPDSDRLCKSRDLVRGWFHCPAPGGMSRNGSLVTIRHQLVICCGLNRSRGAVTNCNFPTLAFLLTRVLFKLIVLWRKSCVY